MAVKYPGLYQEARERTIGHLVIGPCYRVCVAASDHPTALLLTRPIERTSGELGRSAHTHQVMHGDCLEVMRQRLKDASVNLIVTSPPYADQRKNTYGGIHPNDYVDWWLPRAEEMKRVLRPNGSLVLNIKERVVAGQRHTYVLELILEMRKRGWLWTEEYVWHKKNCYPGKWPNRFRDAWERLLHFTLDRKFAMYQEEVMVPMGDWRQSRLSNLSAIDMARDESKVGSGFGKNISNWVGRDLAYPTNVLHMATECANKAHSAAFPSALPEWFIKLFTKPDDIVLDPFMGSGTTLLASKALGRSSVGIDTSKTYCRIAEAKLAEMAQVSIEDH